MKMFFKLVLSALIFSLVPVQLFGMFSAFQDYFFGNQQDSTATNSNEENLAFDEDSSEDSSDAWDSAENSSDDEYDSQLNDSVNKFKHFHFRLHNIIDKVSLVFEVKHAIRQGILVLARDWLISISGQKLVDSLPPGFRPSLLEIKMVRSLQKKVCKFKETYRKIQNAMISNDRDLACWLTWNIMYIQVRDKELLRIASRNIARQGDKENEEILSILLYPVRAWINNNYACPHSRSFGGGQISVFDIFGSIFGRRPKTERERRRELDSLLINAVRQGNIERVRELLRNRADPDLMVDGKPLLHIAFELGHVDCANEILSYRFPT